MTQDSVDIDENVTVGPVQAAPDELKPHGEVAAVGGVTTAVVHSAPDELKPDVTAAAVRPVTTRAVQAAPDELKPDVTAAAVRAVTTAVEEAAPEGLKPDVTAAAVRAVTTGAVEASPDELKPDVTAAAVRAVHDQFKKDVTAAAVHASPDELKPDVTAAAIEATPDALKKNGAAAAAQAMVSPVDPLLETVERAVERATTKALVNPGGRLVKYDGLLGLDVAADNGDSREITEEMSGCRTVRVSPGERYWLRVTIGAGSRDSTGLTLPLRISDGIVAERVEFNVVLDSDDPGLLQPPQSIAVATGGGEAYARFLLNADWEVPTRVWVRVSQRGRVIQHVELTVRAERPHGKRSRDRYLHL